MNYSESVRAARSLASDLGVDDEGDVETLVDDEIFAAYALLQEQGDIYASEVEKTMAGDVMKDAARGVETGAMTVATIRAEELLGRSLVGDTDDGATSLYSFEIEIVDAVDDVKDVRDLVANRTTVDRGQGLAFLRDADGDLVGQVEALEVAQRDDGTVVARLPDVDDPVEHVLGTVGGLNEVSES